MGRELDSHVGVVVEDADELVECRLRTVAQGRLVEVVEDVVDEHRGRDVGQGELQGRVARLLGCLQRLDLFFMIEKTFAGGQEEIAHAGCQRLRERSVAAHRDLLVRAVVADTVDLRLRQFIAVDLIDPAFDGLLYLGVDEGIEMIPAAHVAAIAGEEAAVVYPLEGHAEVVTLRVEGIAGVGERHLPILCRVGDEDVVAAQTGMAGTGEIKVAVGPEGGEGLVALRVDRAAEVLHAA